MGWLFGLKLHLICNEHGELLNFMITSGDVDDRKPPECKSFVEFVYGKLRILPFFLFQDYLLSGKDRPDMNNT